MSPGAIHARPTGSSPHLRGSRQRALRHPSPDRVIPAPAGQPMLRHAILCHNPGHPRTCGAADGHHGLDKAHQGSSPHLRGSRWGWSRVPTGVLTGHPRTCGAAADAFLRSGSPHPMPQASSKGHPRTCGAAPQVGSPGTAPTRVIPAPAGQPCPTATGPPPRWGHPRTCGAADVDRYLALPLA